VVARSMGHLEEVAGRVSGLGGVTTSVVYSSPLPRRSVEPTALAQGETRAERRQPTTAGWSAWDATWTASACTQIEQDRPLWHCSPCQPDRALL